MDIVSLKVRRWSSRHHRSRRNSRVHPSSKSNSERKDPSRMYLPGANGSPANNPFLTFGVARAFAAVMDLYNSSSNSLRVPTKKVKSRTESQEETLVSLPTKGSSDNFEKTTARFE